jgi:hypothetical protein
MSERFVDIVSEQLPLKIQEATYADPVLTLAGAEWSLSVVCPWRLRAEEGLITAFGGDDAEAQVARLVGGELTGLSATGDLGDPIFDLSGGLQLEVFGDTDLDPWVMRLPSHTFVGTGPGS